MTNPIPSMLEGRVALVTGASRGIGRAVAEQLARAGAEVALSARDSADLKAATEQVRRAWSGRAHAFACDVTDAAAVVKVAKDIEAKLGPVDILVNNAGAAASAPFLKTDRQTWDHLLALNLTAVFTLTQAVLPGMLARKSGRIINVASTAGKVGYPYTVAYCASKHGVVGLTRALALEVAARGVTVNAVCPSFVETDMTSRSIQTIVDKTGRSPEDARKELEKLNPQGRLIQPDEVASTVLYLCSDAAVGVNGQALSICGGAVAT